MDAYTYAYVGGTYCVLAFLELLMRLADADADARH